MHWLTDSGVIQLLAADDALPTYDRLVQLIRNARGPQQPGWFGLGGLLRGGGAGGRPRSLSDDEDGPLAAAAAGVCRSCSNR